MSVIIRGLNIPSQTGYVRVTIYGDGTVIKTAEKRGPIIYSGTEEHIGIATELSPPTGG